MPNRYDPLTLHLALRDTPRSVKNDTRSLLRSHRARNPELPIDYACEDVIAYLRRMAGLPTATTELPRKSAINPIPQGRLSKIKPEDAKAARFVAYWAYQHDKSCIDAITRNDAEAILKGYQNIPVPNRPHRPEERY